MIVLVFLWHWKRARDGWRYGAWVYLTRRFQRSVRRGDVKYHWIERKQALQELAMWYRNLAVAQAVLMDKRRVMTAGCDSRLRRALQWVKHVIGSR